MANLLGFQIMCILENDLLKSLKTDLTEFNSKFNTYLNDVISTQSIKHETNSNVWNYSTKIFETKTKSVFSVRQSKLKFF